MADKSIVFVDTEVGVKDQRVHDSGACKFDGSKLHTAKAAEFSAFIDGCEYICGHNICNHDIKYITSWTGKEIEAQVIDTLYLSPLLFPRKPYTNQYDIYSIFDHNIVYEIRLQQALEEDLLCPFHYFGITDLEIDGEVFDDNTGVRNFNRLVSDDRVKYVIEKAEYFGHSGDRVKGLVFCSRKEEAKELSEKL